MSTECVTKYHYKYYLISHLCKSSLQIPVMCWYLWHLLCYSSNISMITPWWSRLPVQRHGYCDSSHPILGASAGGVDQGRGQKI
jgi:hypothetical protein